MTAELGVIDVITSDRVNEWAWHRERHRACEYNFVTGRSQGVIFVCM